MESAYYLIIDVIFLYIDDKKVFFQKVKKSNQKSLTCQTRPLNFCFESDCLSMPWQWEHLATRCESSSYPLSLSLHDSSQTMQMDLHMHFVSDILSNAFLPFFDFSYLPSRVFPAKISHECLFYFCKHALFVGGV